MQVDAFLLLLELQDFCSIDLKIPRQEKFYYLTYMLVLDRICLLIYVDIPPKRVEEAKQTAQFLGDHVWNTVCPQSISLIF